MPRSLAFCKKRNKAAKARNNYLKRTKILEAIENSENYVPEDAHVEYFANLPDEDLPELYVEAEKPPNQKKFLPPLVGNRVVDIQYFIEQIRKLAMHDLSCNLSGRMTFSKETRVGLISDLKFECEMCKVKINLKTQNCNSDVNNSFVWGVSSIGAGYSQAEELFSLLNIPMMTKRSYQSMEKNVKKTWEDLLLQQMRENADEEKRLAIQEEHVEQGIPYITVIVDGGWAKRSYGHSYSSLSGVACIIGAKTKKLLYIGVKNKFCYICATNNGEHECYKNYSGSSTAMEQTIIVEGFNKSEEDYGIRYKFVVGDGDSSVYTRILEHVTYGRSVIKLECANHAVRAFTANLYKLVKNTSFDCAARNIVKSKIANYSGLLRTIIARTPDVNNLRIDLKNSCIHIFGDHTNCRKEICSKTNVPEKSYIGLLTSANMLPEIIKICDYVVRKADRLNRNVTTNYAERYMSLISKFTGGKRTNLIQRATYTTRCIGAGLHFNNGVSFHALSTKLDKYFLNQFCARRQKRKTLRKQNKSKKLSSAVQQDDFDYGTNAAQPELNDIDIRELERETVGQNENIKWYQARTNRLTASTFGKICLRRKTTPCHNLLKELFYKNHHIKSKSMQYGIDNEKIAVKKFTSLINIEVADCGFHVCENYRFLGASPDGVTDTIVKELIEVKCLYSIRYLKIKSALELGNNKLCVKFDENSDLILKNNHHYYYQIQGQLNIWEKEYCYLILYTDVDLQYVKIKRDADFWLNVMLPKLIAFWEECVMPELADPRIPRGLNTRDPLSFTGLQKFAKK